MIGTAKVHDGLYILKMPLFTNRHFHCSSGFPVKSVNTIDVVPKPNMLWHFRLAYASDNCIQHLHSVIPSIAVNKGHIYDICDLPKQKKLPFFC